MSDVLEELREIIPSLEDVYLACPASPCPDRDCFMHLCADKHKPLCYSGLMRLECVIIHLNDERGWTREAVADWLDTLEIDLSFKVKG